MTEWSGRARAIRVLVALAVLGVLLGVVGLLLPVFGGSSDDSGDRQKVVSRANDFAVTMNTFDYAKLDSYRSRVRSLLTPSYYQDFVKNTKATAEVLERNKITLSSGEAKVLGVGIQSIDDDSAEAIVAVDASIMSDKSKAAVPRNFRWKVAFTKSKGEWLVSRFESVAAVEAKATPVPSATPSTGGGDE